ncbi:MAG: TolC family protein [Spirochaetia bacterium]|nr:TolC family protein [Spirochaetia bacterium]
MNKKTILGVLLLMSMSIISAQSEVLLIEDAVAKALEHNISIQNSAISLRSAQRDVDTSWNLFLPKVSLSLANSGAMEVLSSSSPTPNMNSGLQGAVNVSMVLNPAVADQITSYGLSYEIEQITYTQALRSIERSVKKLFYYLLAEKEHLILQKNTMDRSYKRYETVQVNYANGYASQLEVLSSQLTYENLRSSYTALLAAYDTQMLGFKILLGYDLSDDLTLKGSIATDIISLDTEKLSGYLDQNYALELIDLNMASMANSMELTRRSTRMPSLSLSGSYAVSTGSWLEATDAWSAWSDSLRYQIALSIPIDSLISGSQSDVSLQKMQDGIDQLYLSREQTRIGLEQTVITQVHALNATAEQLSAAAYGVELSRRIYDMTLSQYENGMLQLLDVEDAQADLLSAQQQVLSLNYSYLAGLIDLSYDLQIDMSQL